MGQSPINHTARTVEAVARTDGSPLVDQHNLSQTVAIEPPPPPLPPRTLLLDDSTMATTLINGGGSLKLPKRTTRPQLASRPTIALSLADVHTVSHSDRFPSASTSHTVTSRKPSTAWLGLNLSRAPSDAGDTSSVRSLTPSISDPTRLTSSASLLGDLPDHPATPAWKALSAHINHGFSDRDPFDTTFSHPDTDDDDVYGAKFYHEFDPLEKIKADGSNESIVLQDWKSKLKHFLIISSSGKPIWSRHGDDHIISTHVGVLQTLISFHQDVNDQLLGFTAADTRFVIVSKGHLHLMAITKLAESDAQLRTQLESLYMQILSTLTLPSMERMFINRPSTDLRQPLQGTEALLDALADGFVRGSPSTLLTALECLRLRKSNRRIINNSFLKTRSSALLYGLLVAGGRLVSVMRPKKHSLHPSDLHLIFNMLFEAGGVQAGGGESWIPLCLPGFNKTGFLYMYVSFLDANVNSHSPTSPTAQRSSSTAMILISTNKEAFFELRQMRNDLLAELSANGSLNTINSAVQQGRPLVHSILQPRTTRLPKTNSVSSLAQQQQQQEQTQQAQPNQQPSPTPQHNQILHFLYKSRGNVQFVMPSYTPHFTTPLAQRRLLDMYHALHAAVHGETAPVAAGSSSGSVPGGTGTTATTTTTIRPSASLKVHHVVSRHAVGLVWITPLFELYAVASPGTEKNALTTGANRIIEWVKREEERIFIIGGAVF